MCVTPPARLSDSLAIPSGTFQEYKLSRRLAQWVVPSTGALECCL
jgi:hypothetical protein